MTLRLWRLLQGYVIIKVKGPRLERFLNRLARARVPLWDAQRVAPEMLVGAVTVRGFRKVRSLSRAQGWKVAIVQKAGLPFLIAALARRKALVLGGLLAVIALYIASGFVWFVRVEGDDPLPVDRILEVAAANGLYRGAVRDEVDRHRIQQALMLQIDELGWANVKLQGTLATVEAVRRIGLDAGTLRPGDIVAARDGIVTKLVVYNGQGVVHEGDTVKAGDLLISGFIPPSSPEHQERLAQGESPYVQADGVVTARVWYDGKVTIPLVHEIEEPTGKTATSIKISIGDASWRFGTGEPPFEAYQTEVATWRRRLGPIVIAYEKSTFAEVIKQPQSMSRAEAESLGRAAALEHLEVVLGDKVPAEAPEFHVEVVERDGAPAVVVIARAEVVEPISIFRAYEM